MNDPIRPTVRTDEILPMQEESPPKGQQEHPLAWPGAPRGLSGPLEMMLMVLLGLFSGSLVVGGLLAFLRFR